ncbi:hypothetical protein N1689_20695 [Pantoea sp. XY16]|uniref:hypothetical protein n=1 Tax=Pantoea sp. XY16 TaxID=2976705 RepID=UPI0021A81BB4|nr:hypothetical protein [Pantoea sp. XY16]MCT2420273.1 hypothetical protein [Pantoea sp. XY16]
MISVNYNCYTRLYQRKLEQEFGVDYVNSLDVSERLFPLVYICLKHRRIPPLQRNVLASKETELKLSENPKWNLLKSRIEKGEDINGYVSKRTRKWYDSDYLLFSCDIFHIHLRATKGGGIGDDLIYAIVKDDSLYVIRYGNHHDIFLPGELIKDCEKEWPGLHFKLDVDESDSSTFLDHNFFKKNATDHRWGFNLIKPAGFIDEISGKKKFIPNHANSAIVEFKHDDNCWKLPLKCAMAFTCEDDLIHQMMSAIYNTYQVYPDSLELDFERRMYIFKIPTIKGYGNYSLIEWAAPKELTVSFPSEEAKLNWHL